MRIPSKLWVQAYVRRMNGLGAFATVLKHGDDEFGTIWVKLNRLDGTAVLFGPAPSPLDVPVDLPPRSFVRQHTSETMADADADRLVARQRGFDSDLWIVEVEDRAGRHGLDDEMARGA